jgi:leucyl-tRNA synthetase
LGNDFSVHGVVWEKPSEAYLVEEKVVYAVQVNGKLRASFECETKIDERGVVEMAKNLPNVKKYLSEGEVKKTIFVRGRMVSFVVA